jgi:transposase
MDHYIGMDAHSKTCTFVVVNSKGKEVAAQRVNTSEKEIVRFVKSIKGTTHLTFEESQLSRWLHVVLKDEVDELVVCNPCFIAKRTGPKDDYPDAYHLAQQLCGGFLTAVFHDDSFLSDLRKIVSSYEDLTRDLIRAKNRYKALFISRAIDVTGSTVYYDEEKITLLDPASQFVAKKLFIQIDQLKCAKAEYKKCFEENQKKNKQIAALATLPGISAIRANIIAAAVCDPRRFPDKYKFWSYCMLVKHDRQSDGRSYGKVSVYGKTSLKAAFIGATLEVIRQAEGELYDYYEEQLRIRHDQKAARKNLARRLASIALAVMKTGKPYREQAKKKETQKKN